jgi:hypothetical protein
MVLAFWGREERDFPLSSCPSSGSTIFAAHRSFGRSQVLRKTNPGSCFLSDVPHADAWLFLDL